MQRKTLKLGFIGGGINSAIGNTHRISSQIDNRWVLEAGCFSRNHDINQISAEKYGVSLNRTYDDWHNMLRYEKGNLDAVCVLTPPNSHSEIAIESLNMGYAVITEKTMASTYEEAVNICKAVNNSKGFLTVTYNYSGYPMLRELRQMIVNGKLGNLIHIQIEMPQEGFIRLDKGQVPKLQDWRLKDEQIPTIYLDLAGHLHHIIDFLTGEKPVELVAEQSTYGHFKHIIDNVMCIAKYTGDLRVQLWYSKSALGHRNGLRVRVYGSKGSAEWFQLHPEEILFNDNNGGHWIIERGSNLSLADESRYNRFKAGHPAGYIEAFANLYYDIADCLIEFKKKGYYNSTYVFDAFHAKDGLKMLETIVLSAKSRKWQRIEQDN
jgi:predicted dehydrogenase